MNASHAGQTKTNTSAPAAPARTMPTRASAQPARAAPPAFLAKAPPAVSLSAVLSDRVFRTRDGRLIELPPDMTREEASKLEAEAIAAQKRLGLGPPPKPVPDVKKLAPKEEKKGKPEAQAKPKKETTGKGKGPRKPAASPAKLKTPSGSKPAQYLASKAAPVLNRGVAMLQRLRQNEQTHDEASEKLTQSEKAVVNPPSEGQATSSAGQVKTVSGRPAPPADEAKAKKQLQDSLTENVPKTIEDVDNFKRDQKAQHIGADVMKVVQGDKAAVVSTFKDVETTPPPAPPEQTPEALPPQEVAPGTPNLNIGQGAVAPLLPEHTDVSSYTKEADGKLKEEGVTQEQLDMVDSGELAEANKEKKGMQSAAKTMPLEVKKFGEQESLKIAGDLNREEKKERSAIQSRRKTNLGATASKQKGTKSALEKKRDEVANKINTIYKTAQDKVKQKLADLETQSMKRFDEGNAQATKEFENNVNREIDAFKDDRYSGVFGWARKAKDWLLGIDDLPEVKEIFDRNRAAFVRTINKLVEGITADNKRVIQECKDELANARKAIQEYVDKLGPDLKAIGKQAQGEMNAKLDEMDRFVAKKEQELQDKLADKQQAAIKAIDEKIEKMKEAMSGALAKLGKLLLWAAKKFFTWALEKFGFSLSEIEGIINKGVAVLKAIFTQPIQFVKNLVRAASQGFDQFRKNFIKHLKDAVFEWLTGSLEGITLPSSWDLKGIVSVVLQMLGLTWSNIRSKLVKLVGEPAVRVLEATFTLVKTLVTEGPMAAWEQLKEMAGDIQKAFVDAIKEWIRNAIIFKAVETILSFFIPGAGIVRAIIGIYDTIVFFIQKAKDILQMIGNFLSSIGEIAAGNIGAAADALEKGLARALKLVIDFLARFLHLSGITKKIQEAIQKIRGKVDTMLDKVVEWIVSLAKRLLKAGKNLAGKVAGWLGLKKSFKTVGGVPHTLSFNRQASPPPLMIRSVEMSLETFLADLATRYAGNAKKLAQVKQAQMLVGEIKTMTSAPGAGGTTVPAPNAPAAIDAAVQAKVEQLGTILQEIGDGVNLEGAAEAYRGLHWWVDPAKEPGQNETEYQEKLRKEYVGTRQLSDAVNGLLEREIPTGRTPTDAEIDDAVSRVRAKMAALRDSTAYTTEGKTYFDRFHFLLGRFVTSLSAFKRRIAAAVELIAIEEQIRTVQGQLRTFAKESGDYARAKRRLGELESQRKERKGPSVYRELPPEVQASPFISTSTNATLTARYALGETYVPTGKVRRTVGKVGRILIFVASVVQLVKDGTYSIDELKAAGKVRMRKTFTENEITFTGDIPGEYLKAQLDVEAGQSANAVGGNAMGRAAAEAQRFGGLKK